jgi:hypothetical protein
MGPDPNAAQAQRWLTAHPRVPVHVTPASSSWLNQVERGFSLVTTTPASSVTVSTSGWKQVI